MQCSECKKRPATLQLTQVVNGKKQELQVCELCAMKLGNMNHQQEESYSFHDLLSGLFNIGPSQMELQSENIFGQMEEVECSKCHLTFREFQRIGKFGCAECYEAFRSKLDTVFRRVHSGNTKHHGKIPKRQGSNLQQKKQLEQYREQLQQLIQEEAFEKAAIMRDKIKEVENREVGDDT